MITFVHLDLTELHLSNCHNLKGVPIILLYHAGWLNVRLYQTNGCITMLDYVGYYGCHFIHTMLDLLSAITAVTSFNHWLLSTITSISWDTRTVERVCILFCTPYFITLLSSFITAVLIILNIINTAYKPYIRLFALTCNPAWLLSLSLYFFFFCASCAIS